MMASGNPTFILKPTPPYNFDITVKRLHGVNHEMYSQDNGGIVRTLRAGKGVFLVTVTSHGTTESPELLAEIGGNPSDEEISLLRQNLDNLLSLDVDLSSFYRHVEGNALYATLCRRFYGLHIMLEGGLFECMVKTIIGQQMNLSFASTLTRRLIERASSPFVHKGRTYPVFPSPEEVAVLQVEDLTALQYSRRKAEYVIDFAREVVNSGLDLEQFEKMEDREIVERLVRIRGIGRWTAECFLLFGMGRKDLLPAADIGLRNAIKKLYGLSHQPNEQEVRDLGAGWSPWSSYMTFYLWESLNHKSE